jgi:hypothetical protein
VFTMHDFHTAVSSFDDFLRLFARIPLIIHPYSSLLHNMHDLAHAAASLLQLDQLPCTDAQCPLLGPICQCIMCGVPNRAYSSSAPKVKRLVPFAASLSLYILIFCILYPSSSS